MNKILRMLTFTFGLICITNCTSGMSTFRSFGWLEGLSKTERCDKLKNQGYEFEYFLELHEEEFNQEPESALEIIKSHVKHIRSELWLAYSDNTYIPAIARQFRMKLADALTYIDKFELFNPKVREQISKLILEAKKNPEQLEEDRPDLFSKHFHT